MKIHTYDEFLAKYQLSDEEIIYVGVDAHLSEEERSSGNRRNGKMSKKVQTKYGEVTIDQVSLSCRPDSLH